MTGTAAMSGVTAKAAARNITNFIFDFLSVC
jgi:hypothetical protein